MKNKIISIVMIMFLLVSNIAFAACPGEPYCDNPDEWDENNINDVPFENLLNNPEKVTEGLWANLDPTKKEQLFEQNFQGFRGRADSYFSEKFGKTVTGLGTATGITYVNGELRKGNAFLSQSKFPAGATGARAVANGFEFTFPGGTVTISSGYINADNTFPDGSKINFPEGSSGGTVTVNQEGAVAISSGVQFIDQYGNTVTALEDGVTVSNDNGRYRVEGKSTVQLRLPNVATAEAAVRGSLEYNSQIPATAGSFISGEDATINYAGILINGKFHMQNGGVAIYNFDGKRTTFRDVGANFETASVGIEPLLIIDREGVAPNIDYLGYDTEGNKVYADNYIGPLEQGAVRESGAQGIITQPKAIVPIPTVFNDFSGLVTYDDESFLGFGLFDVAQRGTRFTPNTRTINDDQTIPYDISENAITDLARFRNEYFIMGMRTTDAEAGSREARNLLQDLFLNNINSVPFAFSAPTQDFAFGRINVNNGETIYGGLTGSSQLNRNYEGKTEFLSIDSAEDGPIASVNKIIAVGDLSLDQGFVSRETTINMIINKEGDNFGLVLDQNSQTLMADIRNNPDLFALIGNSVVIDIGGTVYNIGGSGLGQRYDARESNYGDQIINEGNIINIIGPDNSISYLGENLEDVMEANALLAQGKTSAGLYFLREIAERSVGSTESNQALLSISDYLAGKGDPQGALEVLAEIARNAPNSPEGIQAQRIVTRSDSLAWIQASLRSRDMDVDQILDRFSGGFIGVIYEGSGIDLTENDQVLAGGLDMIQRVIKEGYADTIPEAIDILRRRDALALEGAGINPALVTNEHLRVLDSDPMMIAALQTQGTDFLSLTQQQIDQARLEAARGYSSRDNYDAAVVLARSLAVSSDPEIRRQAQQLILSIEDAGPFGLSAQALEFGIPKAIINTAVAMIATGGAASLASSVIGATATGARVFTAMNRIEEAITSPLGQGAIRQFLARTALEEVVFEGGASMICDYCEFIAIVLGGRETGIDMARGALRGIELEVNPRTAHIDMEGRISQVLNVPESELPSLSSIEGIESIEGGYRYIDPEGRSFVITARGTELEGDSFVEIDNLREALRRTSNAEAEIEIDVARQSMETPSPPETAATFADTGNCFIGGTKILMYDFSFKNIEDVTEGDYVYGFDGRKLASAKVIDIYPSTGTEFFTINDKITVTPEHPFYVGGRWIKAKDLKKGDYLQDYKGSLVRIEKTTKEKKPVTKVYNLQVDNHHTFFANGILVHNKAAEARNIPERINFAVGTPQSVKGSAEEAYKFSLSGNFEEAAERYEDLAESLRNQGFLREAEVAEQNAFRMNLLAQRRSDYEEITVETPARSTPATVRQTEDTEISLEAIVQESTSITSDPYETLRSVSIGEGAYGVVFDPKSAGIDLDILDVNGDEVDVVIKVLKDEEYVARELGIDLNDYPLVNDAISEVNNIERLEEWGIPTQEVIGYSTDFIIYRRMDDTVTLADLSPEQLLIARANIQQTVINPMVDNGYFIHDIYVTGNIRFRLDVNGNPDLNTPIVIDAGELRLYDADHLTRYQEKLDELYSLAIERSEGGTVEVRMGQGLSGTQPGGDFQFLVDENLDLTRPEGVEVNLPEEFGVTMEQLVVDYDAANEMLDDFAINLNSLENPHPDIREVVVEELNEYEANLRRSVLGESSQEQIEEISGKLGIVNIVLGDHYSRMGDNEAALIAFRKAYDDLINAELGDDAAQVRQTISLLEGNI